MVDNSKILNQFENEYLATMYVAKKSRQLWDLGGGTLTIPESIDWAITNIPPKDLEHRKAMKKQREYERQYGLLDDIVANIDDKDIRDCIMSSGRLSISQKRLVIDCSFDLDFSKFSRVRVIMRMFWDKYIEQEKFNL
jgi:hypothetical protein